MSEDSRPERRNILPLLLRDHANATPDRVFLKTVTGESITYGAFYERATAWARALMERGIEPGDRVASMFRPSIDGVVAWCATSLAGAIHVPLNPLYFGGVLDHALDVVGPALILTDQDHISQFDGLERGQGIQLGVRSRDPIEDSRIISLDEFDRTGGDRELPGLASQWSDLANLMFTSGTTGPSKAVKVTWLQLYRGMSYSTPHPEPGDRFYAPWPLNHLSGVNPIYLMASVGGRVVLRPGWSSSAFMSEIFDHECTSVQLMAEMVGAVNAMDLPPGETTTPLRKVFVAPTTPYVGAMMARLGARSCTWYGSTETSGPIASVGYDPVPTGSCGRKRDGVDLRLVGDDGRDVAPGEVGELWVRTHDPLEMNQGYWGMPEATAKAWLDGWFHTGDLLRVDEAGYYFFESRGSDRIRHRGENVSAWEVELVLESYDGNTQAAVVGVPAGDRDDEIVACVVLGDGTSIDELRAHCERELPKFMWPRRFVAMTELPMTPTGKVQKVVLRNALMEGSLRG